ncbi:NAD(P)-dependent oxidoreductase [Acidisoma cladoniae]|uniref:NAD(P)-dependent oxidoreductase n=1 Tax=Acidisoma cladoniae TaxID=3040935 RepID=UPI00254FC4DC|nr:NAD(P)-dependent oxidoreductase [Acidisoma sp. PAMC 29798]
MTDARADNPRLGWIGLGKMGAPMCLHLIKAGHAVDVFDTMASAMLQAGAEGGAIAASARHVVQSAEIIFISMPHDAALSGLILGAQGILSSLRRGQIIVETSTVSPAMSEEVAKALTGAGVEYLRAPISGSTATAVTAKLTVLASGPEAAYRRIEPLLEAFSTRRFYLGAGEEARYLKLAINMLVGSTSAILAEALTFGRKGNLDIAQMLEVIGESAVASPLIAYKRDMLSRRDFTPAFTVTQMIKDFDLVLDTARMQHIPVYLVALIRQQYEAAYAQGAGEQDFFVLLEQYEASAGLSAPLLSSAAD